MKRLLMIILFLGVLLCGCTTAETDPAESGFLFYFPNEDPHVGSGFTTVERDFGGEVPPLGELIRVYFSMATPQGARSAIPTGWSFASHGSQTDGLLILNFSGRTVSPIEESLALACMTRTFLQVSEIRRVKICPPGDREPMILAADDLLLEDMGMFTREEIVLYFPDEQLRYLRRVTHMVDADTETDKSAYIMNRLLEREGEAAPNTCIPRGTRLLDIEVENGVCILDLSSEFVRDMPRDFRTIRLAVYSIVNSLTELEEIQTVDIKVANSPLEQLGLLDLSHGLQRDESMITGNNGFDGSIYLYDVNTKLLVEVPIWIRGETEQPMEEQLVRALLNYESIHLLRHSIPKGTSLLSVRMAEDTCVVDLTAEFINLSEDDISQKLAVRSIVATLSTLPGVNAVEILVEGNRPRYWVASLRDIRQVDPSWFAEPTLIFS
jgi:spore germination protein GerM